MVLATIFVSLPFVVREVVPVLHEIGDEQEQAAQTLGANWWQTFRRITLPAIRWGVAYGVVLATARALGEFGAVAIVSGRVSGQTETAPLWVWREFGQFNTTGAYTASLVLALIAVSTLVGDEQFQEKGSSLMGISVEGVRKQFGDFVALDGVSIEVPDGSLTALLGPSGSGKSTLLRVIAGLEQPDGGRVVISDRDTTHVPVQDRGVGFVFQHYAAFKHMTVKNNIAFGLSIRKRPKKEIERARAASSCSSSTSTASPIATRPSSRAASASAWRSPGRSPSSPRCCSSTSPSGRSTRTSARSCACGFAASTTRST